MVTALPKLGKTVFVYLEIGLNTWKPLVSLFSIHSIGSSDTSVLRKSVEIAQLSPGPVQQEHTCSEQNDVPFTASGFTSAELFYTILSHSEVFRRVSIQPRSHSISQLNCFTEIPSSKRRKKCHPGNNTWVSAVFAAQTTACLPQEKMPRQV